MTRYVHKPQHMSNIVHASDFFCVTIILFKFTGAPVGKVSVSM